MADIFISYSSRDREQAEQLVDILVSAGLSCWIDNHGIDAAASWSKEIVQAINECSVFVVLLSPASLESHNVVKEVSLASEKRKKILPLDLEPVSLTEDFEYQLAGIQRCSMTNIDAIIRALSKFGLEATSAPQAPKIVKDNSDARKSLIILPFEDLSPTQDNQWFADGLAGELIDMLGKIKSLRILDRKTSLDLRGVKMTMVQLGKEFSTRYFVEGNVRKFGEQIKISVSLLDIETGDHLWQESYKGVMQDIFDLQENVATQVVEGLKLHLTQEEKSLLTERGTDNAEAYELWLKASEYNNRQTKEGFQLCAQLNGEAIHLDPNFVKAYTSKAIVLISLYRMYDRDPILMDEAEHLCAEVQRLRPDFLGVYSPLVRIAVLSGKHEAAERLAKVWIKKEPNNPNSHFVLGFCYIETGRYAEAIAQYEAMLRITPDNFPALTNIVFAYSLTGEHQKCAEYSQFALPHVEKYLRLHPDDENKRVLKALLLHFTGRNADALQTARELIDERSPNRIWDGRSLYNISCLLAKCGEKHEAMRTFHRAIEAGFRDIGNLKEFLTKEKAGIASLAGTPEYEEVKRMIEEIAREAEEKTNG